MRGKKILYGISWDHLRGYKSIEATSACFQALHSDIEIIWDRRSLKDFGDFPVAALAKKYDLILLDHPHLGSAVSSRALLPLDMLLSEDFLKDQEFNSVGRSYVSYHLQGHQWALAVDAAAQVSAYRLDLITDLGVDVPRSWQQVLQLTERLPDKRWVGLPLCQTDAYCTLLSLCANQKGDDAFHREHGFDHAAAEKALQLLTELLPRLYPGSLDMNPIQMLDHMAREDDIVYVPLLFGYSNYARPENGDKLIHFTDIPSFDAHPRGALLGGVGLAISSFCQYRKEAADFVQYAASGEVQAGVYFENAGQPGYLGAWKDPAVNAACANFFADTLETLQLSYLRPRYKGYNAFQEQAGFVLNKGLHRNLPPGMILQELEDLFRSMRRRKEPDDE